jgi:hypothetical protein
VANRWVDLPGTYQIGDDQARSWMAALRADQRFAAADTGLATADQQSVETRALKIVSLENRATR